MSRLPVYDARERPEIVNKKREYIQQQRRQQQKQLSKLLHKHVENIINGVNCNNQGYLTRNWQNKHINHHQEKRRWPTAPDSKRSGKDNRMKMYMNC